MRLKSLSKMPGELCKVLQRVQISPIAVNCREPMDCRTMVLYQERRCL